MPTMKALVTVEGKTAAVQTIDRPSPEAGEILVKIHYVAQNPTDWKAMMGVPPGRIIGCDFAGEVEDPNGSHWSKGQRVAGFVQGTATNPIRGVFAEYAVIESSLVYPIPEGTSFQEAATIPLAFATAVQAMFQRLALPEPTKPSKDALPILINGATSSVGVYAVQLAKLAGLFVVATGSKRNHEFLLSLGADAVVDYNDADWPEQVKKLTNDKLGHVFDCISENGTPQASARAISSTNGGHILTILPVKHINDSGEIEKINKKIKLESTIVYTVFERELQYGAFDNHGGLTPKDRAFWEKYLALLPDLLRAGKLKANRIREMGTIDDILKGFQEQQEGRVRAEKLVYKIAS
ncbi:hypothetical protein B0A52_00597 [Exophiala mesophila]|uniref:Enoyl reductase (ER) domain-containing protein n=1 Tax=Exophiala mesophila TaxID=212818 RepID=A0A438NHN9_EXOME|nr:hypothetical protein B0A52_00597 [Exophiala mesophila]